MVVVAIVVLLVLLAGTAVWAVTSVLGAGWLGFVLALGWAVVIGLVGRLLLHRLRGALAPMGDLIEASERIEAGEVGTQVPVRGPREVRSMARAFNAMSARLAEDAERRKRLLADVSHELRTPLTVIAGTVEGMLDGLYPPDREHLEQLLSEARHMERLVDDLRTLALADAGALPLHREPIDLGSVAAEVVAAFAPQADEAGVSLVAEAEELPELVLDPHRMRQVIGNLVGNALRHTPAGGRISVAVRVEAGEALLEVTDTGLGMDAAAAERAFDRFWRAGDRAGAGLGLSIVRDLVTAHGGTVELASREGRGTTVRCRFPASA
jgi:two-component system sensor histidine kinase BaeS